MAKPKTYPFTIVRDTREQRPWDFGDWPTVVDGLTTGDYSVQGCERWVCVERKSLPDIAGCVGKGRDRFKRELARMRSFDFAGIIVEATFAEALTYHGRGQIKGPQIVGSLASWAVDFNVHVRYACENQDACAAECLRMLRAWYRHKVARCRAFCEMAGWSVT